MDIRRFNLREPKSTDRKLDFTTYHDLVMAVARSLGISLDKEPSIPVIRLMELDEDLPAYDDGNPSESTNKKATVLYLDPSTGKWKRDETQKKENVTNPGPTGYKAETRLLFVYLCQSAKFAPIGVANGESWIEFTPTQTFSTSDAAFTATIDAVHGTVPDAVSDEVTINNTKAAFSGDTSSLGVCANYDSVEDAYYCIQLGCPTT